MTIAEQLTDIYMKHEDWHKTRMSYAQALKYHQDGLKNGTIYICFRDDKVAGYYERFVLYNACFLHNVFVKQEYRHNGVFREMKEHFFKTMPKGVTKIIGEKAKLGGKVIERKI